MQGLATGDDGGRGEAGGVIPKRNSESDTRRVRVARRMFGFLALSCLNRLIVTERGDGARSIVFLGDAGFSATRFYLRPELINEPAWSCYIYHSREFIPDQSCASQVSFQFHSSPVEVGGWMRGGIDFRFIKSGRIAVNPIDDPLVAPEILGAINEEADAVLVACGPLPADQEMPVAEVLDRQAGWTKVQDRHSGPAVVISWVGAFEHLLQSRVSVSIGIRKRPVEQATKEERFPQIDKHVVVSILECKRRRIQKLKRVYEHVAPSFGPVDHVAAY